MNTTASLCLVAVLSLFAASAKAQSAETTERPVPSSNSSKYRINADLVLLDVVVTDLNGAIVDNLSKDDFRIYENDTLQAIRSFEHFRPLPSSSRPSIQSTTELDRKAPDAPVSIIVLDEMTTSFEDRAFARYSLKQYLASEGEVMQQPTMLVAVGRQHFLVLCDYTSSKEKVLSALDAYHPANDSWQRFSLGSREETYTAAFAWLMEVAEATAGHRGHKNMIWIGRGFPNLTDPTITSRGSTMALTSEQQRELDSAFAVCTNALRDARVTLYTVDPVGVSDAPLTSDLKDSANGSVFGGQAEFDSIATLTGGKAFHGRNDVDELIKKSADYGANFYSLSYVPASPGDTKGKFRKIHVAMNDPKLQAVAREGYFVRTPPPVLAEDNTTRPSHGALRDFVLAGQSKVIYDAVPLIVRRDPGNPNSLHISLNASDLAWRRTHAHVVSADATVLIESFDRKDRLLDRDSMIHTVNRAAASPEDFPATSTVTMSADFPADPKASRLRIVVLVNATGKIGADNLSLEK